jgi:protein subunit release factor A
LQLKQEEQRLEQEAKQRSQVGSGDRSEAHPDPTISPEPVTDHRIN